MIIVLSFLCLMALLNFLTAIRMEKAEPLKVPDKVSLLIPLRNESERVTNLLSNLSKSIAPEVEVLLLDDNSNDDTWEKLQSLARRDFRLIQGSPLPQDWVGKPWACSQLAEQASGEIFIFCDADVFPSEKAIERTLSLMKTHQVDAVTALPYQELVTPLEKAIIPFVMHLPIVGLIPLRWVAKLKKSSLVVANGQWLAIKRSAYFQVGGHQAVQFSLLEDMDLGRSLVKAGFKLLPVLATKDLQVRMYDSWKSMEEGFTKNLYLLAGGKNIPVTMVFGISFWIYLGPLILALTQSPRAGLALSLLVIFRAIAALSFRVSPGTVFLHPIGALGFLLLLLRSFRAYAKNQIVWRGREVQSAN